MDKVELATIWLSFADGFGNRDFLEGWETLAIALVFLAILVYREFVHRQHIQALQAATQAAESTFKAEQKQVEKKLHESEARLQTLIDNLPFNCWICDAEGKHLMQNAADVQHWGNLVGLGYEEANLPADILLQFMENRQQVLNGEIWRSEWQYQADNEVQTFMSILAPIQHEQEIQGFVGVTIDITEQKQTEKALRRQEEQYRRIVEMATEGIWVLDRENRTTFVNQQMAKMLGYRVDEMLGQSLFDFMDESGQEIARKNVERRRQGIQEQHDFKFRCRNGADLWAIVSTTPLFDDEQHYIGTLGLITDVTDRKTAEMALRKSEATNRALISAVPDVLFRINHDGTYLDAFGNSTQLKLCRPLSEILGANIYDLLPQEPAQQRMHYIQQALETNELQVYEYQIELDGVIRDEEARIVVCGEQQVLCMLRDITDRKRLERALQASEAKLKDVFNSAVAAITSMRVFADGRWQIDQVSAGCEIISGYTPEELTVDNHLWINRIEPEDWQAIAPEVFTNIFAEKTCTYEYRLHHKDESLRWISQTNNSRWDEVEQGWAVTAISVDITDRKATEIALRESEATNRALISAVPDLLFRINHDGTYLDVLGNSTKIKLYKPLPEVIGRNMYDVLPHDYAKIRLHYIEQALKTKEVQVFEYQFEIDGELRDEETRIAICGEQQVLYIVRDITDRKQAERALQQKESFLELILDTIPELIFWKNRESVYMGGNRLFAATAGLESTDEIIGKTDYDLPWEPGEADSFYQEDQFILQTRQPLLHMVEQRLNAQGEPIWVRVNKVPIPNADGNVIGFLGTMEDITEQKQAEDSLRSRHQELLTLHRISEISLRSPSSKAIFEDIVEEISAATGFPTVAIELYDRVRQMMVFEGIKGLELGDKVLEVPVAKSLSGTVARTGQAIIKHHSPAGCEECADHEDLGQLYIRTFVCLPMIVNQDTIGVLSLAHPEIIQVDDDTLRWIRSLANYLALITHRNQLESSLKQANINLERQVAEQTTELREVIAQLQQEICDRQETEAALRESEERFRRIFNHSPIGIAVAKVTNYRFIMVNQAFCQLLGYTETELLHHSYLSVSHPEDQEKDKPLAIQMLSGDINSYQLEKRYLKKNQQVVWANLTATAVRNQTGDVLYMVGMVQDITERRQAQIALQEAHIKLTGWVSDLERRHQEMTILNEMSDLMQACLTVNEAYVVIAQFMPRLFPDSAGAVFAIDQAKGLVDAVTTWGEDIASRLLFTPNDCFALRRGQPHYVEDTHTSLCCNHLQQPLPTSYFCVPMAAQGETAGVLYLSLPTQFFNSAKQLATTVARQVALAIANLKLYATLQNQSTCDPLTGLFNRRYLSDFLDRELHRAARNQYILSILLIDVDHFKQFNDTFGHDAGDAVLQHLSRFLQDSVRNFDIACRYGGEEMVLILLNASPEATMQRAEQLRQGVKQLTVDYPQALGTITISIGVACFPHHGSSQEDLLQAADIALYQAKAAGRDRAVMACSATHDRG